MYLFGGQFKTAMSTNNLHEFDFKRQKWRMIKPNGKVVPPPMDSHCALID